MRGGGGTGSGWGSQPQHADPLSANNRTAPPAPPISGFGDSRQPVTMTIELP